MSNRAIFALMAVIGAAAIVGLWLLARGGDDGAATQPAKGSDAVAMTAPGGGTTTAPTAQPSLPTPGPGRVRPDTSQPFKGGDERDHRSGNRATFETGDTLPAPVNNRRLQPALTKAVADRVRAVMHECVKSVPAEAKGANPRLEGTINIAIKSSQVSINKADLLIKDVTGDPGDALRKCIVDRSKAITQPAGDELDLESYDITLSFALI